MVHKNKSTRSGWSVSVMEKDGEEEGDNEETEAESESDGDTDSDDTSSDSMPMTQSNLPASEETEYIVNREGEIVDERIRNDIP